jgi:5-methyltetrahydrofolate--homocysteine methyltransferase
MMDLRSALRQRVLVLDGAMGTMIQRQGLTEADFRGLRFADHQQPLAGCNDLLCLTRPDVIAAIHRQYISAGADIIETDTFNSNAVSLEEYGLAHMVRELNLAGARLARSVAGDRAFVAGSMGPTGVSLSIPQTGAKQYTFDDLEATYFDQASALIEGGVDALLIETIFDTLNAKAAIAGSQRAMASVGREVPIMLSATLTETGRLLSGQTIAAFLDSVAHAQPLSVGLNCGFGADGMAPYLSQLADAPYFLSIYPNAGLPDEMGNYVETPRRMAQAVAEMLKQSPVNVVGGCCGTTPEHIRMIAQEVRNLPPRRLPESDSAAMTLSGLQALSVVPFQKVGERCNVAGSRKFLRLINEGNYDEAIDIAASQIAGGATILDINMDDGLLDAPEEMARFVQLLTLDARTASVPLMIDSSNFDVIRRALRLIQGRAIVNSISLKEGEEIFLEHAREIRRLGAAVVVMAFDEQGQADTYERRIAICERSYRLLTQQVGFSGGDIVFDPNVLAVATGIESHADYAVSFMQALRWIKANLPGAKVSGGVSNLSFAFRGNNPVREAMHAAFLEEAIADGMDMAIVNPSTALTTEGIDPTLLKAIRDVLHNSDVDATMRLVSLAEQLKPAAPAAKAVAAKRTLTPSEQLAEMVVKGGGGNVVELMPQVLQAEGSPLAVVNNVLMAGMNRVGELFGSGQMFLPQVVRSASVMKEAVEWLTPHFKADEQASATSRTMVLATVKGDVHDIGKNIVAVVMRCAGFNIVDLGVMVPAQTIVDKAIELKATAIGLSGLITPSLHEMCVVAQLMQSCGLKIPLFVGGATTSDVHTAVKIAPLYDGPVIHTVDAASLPKAATHVDAEATARHQEQLRADFARRQPALSPQEALSRKVAVDAPAPAPLQQGTFTFTPTVAQVRQLINFRALLGEWRVPADGKTDEAKRLIADANAELDRLAAVKLTARVVIAPASGHDNTITVGDVDIPTPRQQHANPVDGSCVALADFVAPKDDHIAMFAVTVPIEAEGTEYPEMLRQTVCHRLAEATTEWLHRKVRRELWPFPDKVNVRPAVGYPSLPDQSLIFTLDKFLHFDQVGIRLTENGAMYPPSSTAGLIFGHPAARYFAI